MIDSENETATIGQRDDKGKFLPGNRASVGNGRVAIKDGGKPNINTLARRAIEENIIDIVNTMIEQAKAGDMTTAKNLLDRITPTLKSIEHVGLNVDSMPRMEVRSKDGASSQVIEGETIDVTPPNAPDDVTP
mgnify:CR=1 FL=1